VRSEEHLPSGAYVGRGDRDFVFSSRNCVSVGNRAYGAGGNRICVSGSIRYRECVVCSVEMEWLEFEKVGNPSWELR